MDLVKAYSNKCQILTPEIKECQDFSTRIQYKFVDDDTTNKLVEQLLLKNRIKEATIEEVELKMSNDVKYTRVRIGNEDYHMNFKILQVEDVSIEKTTLKMTIIGKNFNLFTGKFPVNVVVNNTTVPDKLSVHKAFEEDGFDIILTVNYRTRRIRSSNTVTPEKYERVIKNIISTEEHLYGTDISRDVAILITKELIDPSATIRYIREKLQERVDKKKTRNVKCCVITERINTSSLSPSQVVKFFAAQDITLVLSSDIFPDMY